jgi:pimeloyl-ACP methyl ester carboxylesterase
MFLRRAPRSRDAFIEHMVRVFDLIASPGYPRDRDEIRRLAAQSYDRDSDPAGAGRQLAAILAAGNRTSELRRITAPTLVIHGTGDRLVAPSGGRATARAIRGARLMLIEGMGHDLPRAVWPQLIDAITDQASEAERTTVEHPPLQARPATAPGL